jgi:peptidoglycan/xylan/chitin deacetylase (PgdA/CDA1 family)
MSSLPILMYHNIVLNLNDSKDLNLSVQKFEQQLAFLQLRGYTTYHFSELENLKKISSKSVILTFDDVTKNQMEFAIPLLEKYNFKATFFIPFKYVGGFDEWNDGNEPLMSLNDLKSVPKNIELAHHSFAHGNLANTKLDDIEEDLKKAEEYIKFNQLNIFSALAYPYGKYPKKDKQKKNSFFKILQQKNIIYGLRIGNRVNKFPFKNPYEILRIDIKGQDSFLKFRLKLKFGKLKLF